MGINQSQYDLSYELYLCFDCSYPLKSLISICFPPEPRSVLDLVFAIDGSNSMTTADFTRLKETVKRIIEKQRISPLDTHVAVVEYSDRPSVQIYLGDTFDRKELNERLDLIPPSLGQNAIVEKALDVIAKDVLSVAKGGRPGAAKILVILSDGDSSEVKRLENAANQLKDSGVKVYVVSIGDRTDPDGIMGVVTTSENIFVTPDASKTPSVGPELGNKIKNDVKKGKR